MPNGQVKKTKTSHINFKGYFLSEFLKCSVDSILLTIGKFQTLKFEVTLFQTFHCNKKKS
jgi:hypothetical protein